MSYKHYEPEHRNNSLLDGLESLGEGLLNLGKKAGELAEEAAEYIGNAAEVAVEVAEDTYKDVLDVGKEGLKIAGELLGLNETTTSTITIYNEPQGILYPMRDVITTKVVGGLGSYYERARKYVRFAAHCYPNSFSNSILPYNCKVIEKHKKNNGLRATLYMIDDEIICAFAGTEASNISDWEANFTQLIGDSQQYEDALEYGRSVCERYPSRKIVFVGHSKGGGEAAYCAYNLGKQAETFNPAGLSILTKYFTGSVRDDAEVNAYVFSTDILNNLQNAFGGGLLIGADGDKHLIATLKISKYGIHGVKGILKYFDII